MANLLTSRLSPFSLSLLNSPPTLPPIPTLADLQERAKSIGESLPGYTPTWLGGGTPPPVYTPPAPLLPQTQTQEIRTGTGARIGSGVGIGGERGGRLKKGKKGWKRLDDEVGDKDKVEKEGMEGKSASGRMELGMVGSRVYARSTTGRKQPEIAELVEDKEVKRGWFSWMGCGA